MDVPEDRDVYLHRVASSFIAELKESLPKFLHKNADDPTNSRIRGSVRHLTMSRLIRAVGVLWSQIPIRTDDHLSTS